MSEGLGRLMGGSGGSGGAALSGGEFQTARLGFVLIFVLHGLVYVVHSPSLALLPNNFYCIFDFILFVLC